MEFTVGKMGRTYTTQIYSKLTGKNGSISLAGTVIWQCLFYLASIVLLVVWIVILHRTSIMAISYISTHQSSPRNEF